MSRNCRSPSGRIAHRVFAMLSIAVLASSAQAAVPRDERISDVAERLAEKITLRAPNVPFDDALDRIGDEAKIKVVLLNKDLQQEGITKNQRVFLEEVEQPAGDVLRKLLLTANPDGKLVYFIKLEKGSDEQSVYITTRRAAAKRGDKLPPEFDSAE